MTTIKIHKRKYRPYSLATVTIALLVSISAHASIQGIIGTSFNLAASAGYIPVPDGLPNRELEVDCDAQSPIPLPDNVDQGAAVVLWMRPAELQRVSINSVDHRVYISSTLVDQDFSNALPESVATAFAAHPFLLPGSRDAAYVRFLAWARSRGIDIVHPRLQSEAFFACMAANDALSHLGRFFIREYALDMLDHAQGLAAYLPNYPRPGFGPGQRFLSKGGYILPVVAGDTDSEATVWILP